MCSFICNRVKELNPLNLANSLFNYLAMQTSNTKIVPTFQAIVASSFGVLA